MKKQLNPSIKAQLLRSALLLLSLLGVCAIPFALAQPRSRGAAKPNVINPTTRPIPFATTGPWQTTQKLANGAHKPTTPSFVFTVTNTNDSGAGSLRQAILGANVAGGSIIFNIPGAGVHTISPVTPLATLTNGVIIDGYTQHGSSPNINPPGLRDNAIILIQLSGGPSANFNGLNINGDSCGVRGLVINRFQLNAINIGFGLAAHDNVIQGNFIGTNAAGTAALPNGAGGIVVAGPNNTIGGTTPAARNLISGNIGDGIVLQDLANVVQGNFIGTDVTGSRALGNTQRGVTSNGGNIIGGNTEAARNVISGNNRGIELDNDSLLVPGDVVQGNFIGTDLTGTRAVPNPNVGVDVGVNQFSGFNTIGGLTSTPGTPPGNLISGNGTAGIVIVTATGNIVQGNIIGADITGTRPLGNEKGIYITGSFSSVGGTTPGAGNIIAFNGTSCDVSNAGVIVSGGEATGNSILGNSIFSNGGLGIDLTQPFDPGRCGITPNHHCDTVPGPNNFQNYPVLTSAASGGGITTIQGSLDSVLNKTFRIEFFDNHQCHPSGNGSGETFIGSTDATTDDNCTAPITAILPVNVQPGHVITATATDSDGNTSEFSACVSVTPGGATPTPTATPSGTPSPTGTPSPGSCVSYEAESGTLTGGAVILSCPTCSDGHKVGFVGNNSGTLQFNGVSAVAAGRYSMTICYANGDPVRYALLSVNGSPGTPLSFPSTGSFQTVGSIETTITLNAGNNTLKFNNPIVGSWAPDFDRIQFNCPTCAAATLGNISTRSFVQTGDNAMIGGFIVRGGGTKRVILRAIGPELTQHGVPDPLQDPTLELHNANGAVIASNNDWQHTIIGGIIARDQVQEIQNSGHAPGDPSESAIVVNLSPGNYTAIVRGVNNTTGTALVEVYDLNLFSGSFLGNISTRSFVQTGDNVMIGGFIVEGTQATSVIMRAIGPELSQYGVPDFLADPTLELHDGSGALIASNNNWQQTIIGGIITSNQVQDIQNSGHAPMDPTESAIIATLSPGSYTAIVRGVNNTTGVALVEVYDLQ